VPASAPRALSSALVQLLEQLLQFLLPVEFFDLVVLALSL